MSRINKWKPEKTKVKVVFRLQFLATHIPPSGWDKLFISFIPSDSGKPSAKTTKANVRNGSCKWGDPIYETTRLLQDSKTKQYEEKQYKLVVAMGSSRSGILGEATINLADYVDALKPSAIALPLHGCNFGTILHITIQLLTSKTGFREFEQQRERGLQSGADNGKLTNSEEVANDQNDKARARVRFKEDSNEISSLEEDVNLNEEFLDGSSNTSGSLYAEKHEIDSLRSPISSDQNTPSHSTQICDSSNNQNMAMGNIDYSVVHELAMAREENIRLKESLELSESSFVKLKTELNSLERLTNEIGNETLIFSQILDSEKSSTQELAKEVSVMKSNCREFKNDLIKFQEDSRFVPQEGHFRFVKGISLAEGKIRDLQKNPYFFSLDREGKVFVQSELETLVDILQDLKSEQLSQESFGLDLCQPESILHQFDTPPTVPNGAIDAMKGQIFDLIRELDESKVEKEALTSKMDQMECYYEALIQELEETQKRMAGELQHLGNEHSICLSDLSSYRAEIESTHQEMNRLTDEIESTRQEMSRLSDEVESTRREMDRLTDEKKELEKRANTSDAALRRARLNYSIAVDKLQKDLELLSSQVVSMFEINENVIKRDFMEQDSSLREISAGQDVLLEDLKRSFLQQEGLYRKIEEELIEIYYLNLNLDVYSKALQESLFEANSQIGISKGKINELLEESDLFNRLLKQNAFENEELRNENGTLNDSIFRLEEIEKSSSGRIHQLMEENRRKTDELLEESDLFNRLLKQKAFENEELRNENETLRNSVFRMEEIEKSSSGRIDRLMEENRNLENKRVVADVALDAARSEILSIKKKFKSEFQEMAKKLEVSNILVDKLHGELESVADKLRFESEIEEKFVQKGKLLLVDLALLEDEMRELTSKNGRFAEEISRFDAFAEEFERNELTVMNLLHEKQELSASLKDKTQEFAELSSEINSLNENYRSLMDELRVEKVLNDELKRKLLDFEQQKSELSHVKELALNLELEKSHLLEQQNVFIEELERKNENLRTLLNELDMEKGLNNELKGKFLDFEGQTSQLTHVKKLSSNLESEKSHLLEQQKVFTEELERKNEYSRTLLEELGTEKSLNDELKGKLLDFEGQISELSHIKELASNLELEKSQLLEQQKVYTKELERKNENLRSLIDELRMEKVSNDELKGKLDEFEARKGEFTHAKELASNLELEKSRLVRELEQQGVFIKELEGKNSPRESFDIELFEMCDYSLTADLKVIYVENQYESIVEEFLHSEALWSEEKSNLLMNLQKLKLDLEISRAQARILSETNDEIKIHLDECSKKLILEASELEHLKNKAIDRDEEITDLAISKEQLEILLIVFEAKLKELSNRLSKQILETEEFKNLSIHLREKESEPRPVVVHDSLRMAFIKEQCESKVQELTQQLLMSKKHGEEMLLKLQDTIDEVENRKKSEAGLNRKLSELEGEFQSLINEKWEKVKTHDRIKAELECALLSLECCKEEKQKLEAEKTQFGAEIESLKGQLENSKSLMLIEKDENGSMEGELVGSQKLRSSMEHLHEELEKMKNENSIFRKDYDEDPDFRVPHREIMQLHKVNEELRSMFPLFNEISSSGNALERVLALEIELAEALKAKNKVNKVQFQSSFLKHHGDEEAVFKSFRDINELIEEMLELKGKYAEMELELRDMHERYSQLSLQHAEVEGDRQKLKMTLKNFRTSRKLVTLNRLSSAPVMDNSS